MKEINCEIIQDLLPGYIDHVISETSRNAVEHHLESCHQCKIVYEEMSADLITLPEKRALPDFGSLLKKIQKIFFRKGVFLSIFIVLILTLVYRCYQYAVTPMPVPPEAVSVAWEDEADGGLTLKISADEQYLVDLFSHGWREDRTVYRFILQTNLTQIDQKLDWIPFLGLGRKNRSVNLNEQELHFSAEERKNLKVIYDAEDYWGNTGMMEKVVVYDADALK